MLLSETLTPLIERPVIVGFVRVLFVRVCVPSSVTTVLSILKSTVLVAEVTVEVIPVPPAKVIVFPPVAFTTEVIKLLSELNV